MSAADEFNQAYDLFVKHQNDLNWLRQFAVYASGAAPEAMVRFETYYRGFSTVIWGLALQVNADLAPKKEPMV